LVDLVNVEKIVFYSFVTDLRPMRQDWDYGNKL
jgi:hypothetical protein